MASGFHPARGEMIDIGGRRLRLVRAGTRSTRPTILCEAGAFGCASDWAEVQARLATKGLYSLAYDRAGLGHSDPGPRPRDGRAIADDLAALLAQIGEAGPLVLVGHSMAGQLLRVSAPRLANPILGVVLVDAVTPELMKVKPAAGAINAFRRAMNLVEVSAQAGYMRPVSLFFGDKIGLAPEASMEKRRIWGSAVHARWSAQEVGCWRETAAQGLEAGFFPPEWPVAVVTAGAERLAPGLKALQAAPARASAHGHVEHVAGADHANLLGRRFADPIVRGVEHVLAAVDA